MYLSFNIDVFSSARLARRSAAARSLAVSLITSRALRMSISYISLTLSVCDPHLFLEFYFYLHFVNKEEEELPEIINFKLKFFILSFQKSYTLNI
jgi:hypothetical protein